MRSTCQFRYCKILMSEPRLKIAQKPCIGGLVSEGLGVGGKHWKASHIYVHGILLSQTIWEGVLMGPMRMSE